MLYGDFVFGISLLQTILFALFAILTLFQGRLNNPKVNTNAFNILNFIYSPFPVITSIYSVSKSCCIFL
ncbi:hypothetical protein [Leptospira noguchii]|uniref:hypothetical protein n=1 Tax=Leptospira noguchii TaxID=28182 RepID=UPI0009E3A0BB|nr:hypothetical protein [Leptospira noguchii]